MLSNVPCNIGMTCVTTQTVGSELFLVTMVWLVLQHKQLGLNCFLQHWYDLCYNTNSWSELFLTTLVWLVLQHKSVALKCFLQHWYELCYNTKGWVWIVSCNIGMTCITTQTVALKCFLQHWDDLCYNINSCFDLFLATLVWLVLQHKQLVWIVSYNIGMTCVTTQTAVLNCFLQHWYDLCYNTNSCFELFLATLGWLLLQHKQLLWTVSCNIGMTCVTT